MININKIVKKILPETLYIYLQNKKRLYGLPKQIKSIVSNLTSDDVCIDCGANVGVYSQLFASYGAKVYSFEPNPIAFNILKKKSEKFKNITPIMSAVGISNTESNLYLHKDFHLDEVLYSQSSSLIKKKNNLSESSIRIDVINFSEWITSGCGHNLRWVFVNGWFQGADKGELPILTGVVEPISDHKFIRNRESGPSCPKTVLPAFWFVQKNTGLKGGRFFGQHLPGNTFHGVTSI